MPTPYRKGLSRDRVLDVALQIVSKHGLDALTIRALASKLRVTPMAVYRHYRDKDDLVDGLLERIIEQAEPTAHNAVDPSEWLITTFTRMRDALRRHPGILPLLGTGASYGPNTLAILEQALARLLQLGLSPEAAVRTFHRTMSYTIGTVVLEMAASMSKREQERLLSRLQDSSLQLPITASVIGEFAALLSGERFELGLREFLTNSAT